LSSRFSEYKEIQNCSISKKSHDHHLLGCKGHALHAISDYRIDGEYRQVLCNITITQATHPQNQEERNKFLLNHGNARSHFRAQSQDAMTSLKFTVVPHALCRPDLAPSDFWLFPKLKETLKSHHFSSDAEAEAAVRKWISSQSETFFMDGMNK